MESSRDAVAPDQIAVCLTCGMIETLRPVMEQLGRIPTDHACEYTELATEQGLQIAALLSEQDKANRLPRCADCGALAPSIWSFSEGKARCKPCAQSNWRELWKESVEVVVEDAADDPIEQVLRYGRFQARPDDQKKLLTGGLVNPRGRPRVAVCVAGQKCESCGATVEWIYNHNEAWRCQGCIEKLVDEWNVYVTTSDPYEASTGHPVRRNRRLLSAWREAQHLTVLRTGE